MLLAVTFGTQAVARVKDRTKGTVSEWSSGLMVLIYREKTSSTVVQVTNVFIMQREYVILLNGEEKKAEI